MKKAPVSLLATALLVTLCVSAASRAQGVHKVATLPATAQVRRVVPCGASDLVVGMGKSGAVYVWRLSSGALLTNRPPQKEVSSVACSPDGRMLALGTTLGSVLITDISGKALKTLSVTDGRIVSLTFSPDGTLLAVNANPSPVELWDAARGTRVARLQTGFGGTKDLDFSPDSKLIATADNDTAVRIYGRDGALHASYTDLLLEPFGISFLEGGQQVAVGGADSVVTILNASDGHMVRQLPKHTDPIFALTALPGGMVLTLDIDAATLQRFTVARYDLATGAQHVLGVDGEHLVGSGKAANHTALIFTAERDSAAIAWAIDKQE